MPVLAAEVEMEWDRLPLPPVSEIAAGLCPIAAPMTM
jgi:hypothetical protein